jgi:DNA-binding GntR family transcriptional regulator
MLVRERVYQAIKNDVLSGVYRMGERLSVDDLSEQYGVSKTPVREALSALQHEGIIDIVPRVGYFVSHMTIEEVQNLFQLRLILEGASAELAAEHITEQELLELETIPISWTTGDLDSHLRYLKDNREFHLRVALATRNRHLAGLVASLLDRMQALLLWELELRNWTEEFADEHWKLLTALRKGDRALARTTMEEAINNMREAVLEAVVARGTLPIVLANTDRE